jgi:hypothetical protein
MKQVLLKYHCVNHEFTNFITKMHSAILLLINHSSLHECLIALIYHWGPLNVTLCLITHIHSALVASSLRRIRYLAVYYDIVTCSSC